MDSAWSLDQVVEPVAPVLLEDPERTPSEATANHRLERSLADARTHVTRKLVCRGQPSDRPPVPGDEDGLSRFCLGDAGREAAHEVLDRDRFHGHITARMQAEVDS